MTHPIIKTDNYLLVVDESEIKKGDWYDDEIIGINKKLSDIKCAAPLPRRKIIYHLPLNNAPTLEGVLLLPPLEDGLFVLGMKERSTLIMYTEGDLRKAIDMARKRDEYLEWEWHSEKIIQFFQQPKYPVAFESEMELCEESCKNDWCKHRGCQNPINGDSIKTITNSQVVGKYIY
jgi:hypothetical protein